MRPKTFFGWAPRLLCRLGVWYISWRVWKGEGGGIVKGYKYLPIQSWSLNTTFSHYKQRFVSEWIWTVRFFYLVFSTPIVAYNRCGRFHIPLGSSKILNSNLPLQVIMTCGGSSSALIANVQWWLCPLNVVGRVAGARWSVSGVQCPYQWGRGGRGLSQHGEHPMVQFSVYVRR